MAIRTGKMGLALLSGAFFLLVLTQCGGDKSQRSDDAKIAVLPESPIVFTSKTVVNGTDVSPPWFRFQVELDNQTDSIITVVGLKIKVTATINGVVTNNETSFDPSQYNYSTDVLTCNYAFFGEFAVGEKKRLRIDHTNGSCNNGSVLFYVGANPKPDDDLNPAAYRYRVELQPLGWFGAQDDPTDRFQKKVYFYSQ